MSRRFKWFIVKDDRLHQVRFEDLRKHQTVPFGFLVPKTARMKNAVWEALNQTDVAPKIIEYADQIAIIFEPEDGLWSARKLRMAITRQLERR